MLIALLVMTSVENAASLRIEDADTEVKPIHHNIGGNGKSNDKRPDDSQIDHGVSPFMTAAIGVTPADRMGVPSRPASCGSGGFFIR